MTVNEKLIEFASYKGFTQYKFCKNAGIADGALRGSRSVGVENLAKIKLKNPELNLDWIMFNKGPMVLGGDILKEPSSTYKEQLSIDEVIDARIELKFEEIKDSLIRVLKANTKEL